MTVPVTSDLEGYLRFWTFWLITVVSLGAAFGAAVIVLLLTIIARMK